MNFEEFLTPRQRAAEPVEPPVEEEEIDASQELDIQKVVVEELAADKAAQEEHITALRKNINDLRSRLAVAENQLALKTEEISKSADRLFANVENEKSPNQVSLLERNLEIADRFPGESRDHLLEAIKEARDLAEKQGKVRRAQILEAVLLANEPSGELAKKREELINHFQQNGNIVNGTMMEELNQRGISYKHGEEYLMPHEIINRNY